jgi:hypothetical protein
VAVELPGKIEQCLATLSKLYASEGERQLQEIIVNTRAWVKEQTVLSDDQTCGHTLYLAVPEPIYLARLDERASVQARITQDLNNIHNVSGEFFH